MVFALKPLLVKLTGGNAFLDRYMLPGFVACGIGLFHHLATTYPVPLHYATVALAIAGVQLTDVNLTNWMTAGFIAAATLIENHISVPGLFAARPTPPVRVETALLTNTSTLTITSPVTNTTNATINLGTPKVP